MPDDLQPSWENDTEIGNEYAKGDPNPGKDAGEVFLNEEEEAATIDFLKSLGKSDEEIDKILGISAGARPPRAPLDGDEEEATTGPRGMFNGDRQGQAG